MAPHADGRRRRPRTRASVLARPPRPHGRLQHLARLADGWPSTRRLARPCASSAPFSGRVRSAARRSHPPSLHCAARPRWAATSSPRPGPCPRQTSPALSCTWSRSTRPRRRCGVPPPGSTTTPRASPRISWLWLRATRCGSSTTTRSSTASSPIRGPMPSTSASTDPARAVRSASRTPGRCGSTAPSTRTRSASCSWCRRAWSSGRRRAASTGSGTLRPGATGSAPGPTDFPRSRTT